MTRIPIICAFLIIPFNSQAKVFKNTYIQFQLPPRWTCELNQKAWVCRHKVPTSCKKNPKTKQCDDLLKKSREAVIIFAAKEKTRLDSLRAYKEQLATAKKLTINGRSSQSKLIHNKVVKIKGQVWADSMHLSSELPHYYTRYLATIRGDVAVLVTFSAHKKYYSRYSSQIFNGIKSLNVTTASLSKISKAEISDKAFSRPLDFPPDFLNQDLPLEQSGASDPLSSKLFGLAMLLMAFGVYLWIKRKK